MREGRKASFARYVFVSNFQAHSCQWACFTFTRTKYKCEWAFSFFFFCIPLVTKSKRENSPNMKHERERKNKKKSKIKMKAPHTKKIQGKRQGFRGKFLGLIPQPLLGVFVVASLFEDSFFRGGEREKKREGEKEREREGRRKNKRKKMKRHLPNR